MDKISVLITFMLLNLSSLFSQESLGIALSNYSPTSSVHINPSSTGDSKVFWEINIVGINSFIDNNYVFLPKTSLLSLSKHPNNTPDLLDNFTSSNKWIYADVSVAGPSFSYVLGKHSFGLITQVRTIVDVRNLPADLAKFSFEGFKFLPQRGIEYAGKNIKINTMAWGELGLNYAYIFKQEKNDMFIGGVTLKRLFGIAHSGIHMNELTYSVPDTSNIDFVNIEGKYGLTTPSFNSGKGWGIDLGVTYKKTLSMVDHYSPYTKRFNCKKSAYKYKISAAILDLGWINFRTDAYYGELDNVPGVWEDYGNSKLDGTEDNVNKIISSFAEVNNQKSNYRAFMPTAISLQYDYNFENGFYLNGTIIQNLSFFNQLGVNRQNLFAITPRFEQDRFEISMPFSMRRYTKPSIGLALRLWNNITIGTDRIGPLLFKMDMYGMDFYVALKIARVYTKKCKTKRVASKFSNYRTNDCFY